MADDFERVLSFWFGELDEHGLANDETRKRWWTKSKAFDDEVREAFLADHRAIVAGEREDWLGTPRGRLAYVIVLDQLSRNMFRDSAEMYAADERVQKAVVEGLERGDDEKLQTNERVFFYMPLMHSEELAHQDRCCELFSKLSETCPAPATSTMKNNLKYAVQHRDIVARFDRFPHRNAILDRESTQEERAFLEEPGSSF